MMRRFTRRRRGGSRPEAAPIDAASWMQRLSEDATIPVADLEVLAADELPANFAALAKGTAPDGSAVLVAFSPKRATDALLAGLAVAGRLAESEEKWNGELLIVASEWPATARRVLGLVGELPYRFRALSAPALTEGPPQVEAEAPTYASVLSPAQIAGHIPGPADRDLFLRASRGLEGLAAKHGGVLRGTGRAVEFVLLASRVAELRAEDGGVVLATILPQRSKAKLTTDGLAGTLDGFEGQLRKHLNDRRVREGDPGLRARAISDFRAWHSLRALVPWPLGGTEAELLDWVGVDVEGRPVIGAVRSALSLEGLSGILDATLRLLPSLPGVLAHAAPPIVFDAPRLVVGGRDVAPGVVRVLNALSLTHELFEIRDGREGIELVALAEGEAPTRSRPARRPRGGRREREDRPDAGGASSGPPAAAAAAEEGEAIAAEAEADAGNREGSGRSRGRRRRGRRAPRGAREENGSPEGEGSGEASEGSEAGTPRESRATPQFEEISVFDLDDESSSETGPRRRGRSRRRGRRGAGSDSEQSESSPEEEKASRDEPAAGARGRGGGRSRRRDGNRDRNNGGNNGGEGEESAAVEREVEEDVDDGFDLTDDDGTLDLDDVPDFEIASAPVYEDDDEENDEDSGEGEADGKAKSGKGESRADRPAPAPAPEPEAEVPRLPRGRGAIIAHSDVDSLAAAVLLARDIRVLDGLWIYPQDELMNFFRNVTTDLREDTAIFIVGFTPNPVVDVLQAASLYRDRIVWFDHHAWPPEDIQALRDSIGENWVNVTPGAGSSLPAVIDACSRRSRFTDKLVDLVCGRFTQHDYERWGRLWWWRLQQVVAKGGECKADIELLLTGRPSDLSKEASKAEVPPVPAEVEYVSSRDFRLVHFAGYGLVLVPVPEEFDMNLAARIARERYDASLSLAYRPEDDLVIFAGDELTGKRSLDMSGLAEHVSQKLEWVEQLADDDHVARFRVREMSTHPERLDEIVGEIAMGRSILER